MSEYKIECESESTSMLSANIVTRMLVVRISAREGELQSGGEAGETIVSQ